MDDRKKLEYSKLHSSSTQPGIKVRTLLPWGINANHWSTMLPWYSSVWTNKLTLPLKIGWPGVPLYVRLHSFCIPCLMSHILRWCPTFMFGCSFSKVKPLQDGTDDTIFFNKVCLEGCVLFNFNQSAQSRVEVQVNLWSLVIYLVLVLFGGALHDICKVQHVLVCGQN